MCAIDKRTTQVSNYRCPITETLIWIPVIGHPRDRAPIRWQIGARRTNHDREFRYRYGYAHNIQQWSDDGDCREADFMHNSFF